MKEFDFEKVPIVEIANEILLDGVKHNASDIHFDPYKDGLVIRMRVDGVLYDYANVPASYKRNMISRIKMIASMNIMETRLPQDGAIKSKIGNKSLDLRVSSLPTYNGEKVVLRILDYSKSLQGLDTLGFSENSLNSILKILEMPNGIILVTGATGSGKSTTVYSILQKLNTREVNIITVEDPVEMEIEGLNQVQAQQEIGLDFATALRSILRQDPDIIMIGEIRDDETARIAVRASITGHKVVSTIHTNNALNTIERLTDMEVERYLIGTSLNGIISQKLVRKLCPHCRIARETNDYEKKLFKKVLFKNVDKVYEPNPEGCEHCFKGYRDRTAIAEVLVITDEIRNAITNFVPKEEMRKLVYIGGHTHTLLEDGLEKIEIGETSFEEIYKVVDLENDLAVHEAFGKELKKDRNRTTDNNVHPDIDMDDDEEFEEQIENNHPLEDNDEDEVIEEKVPEVEEQPKEVPSPTPETPAPEVVETQDENEIPISVPYTGVDLTENKEVEGITDEQLAHEPVEEIQEEVPTPDPEVIEETPVEEIQNVYDTYEPLVNPVEITPEEEVIIPENEELQNIEVPETLDIAPIEEVNNEETPNEEVENGTNNHKKKKKKKKKKKSNENDNNDENNSDDDSSNDNSSIDNLYEYFQPVTLEENTEDNINIPEEINLNEVPMVEEINDNPVETANEDANMEILNTDFTDSIPQEENVEVPETLDIAPIEEVNLDVPSVEEVETIPAEPDVEILNTDFTDSIPQEENVEVPETLDIAPIEEVNLDVPSVEEVETIPAEPDLEILNTDFTGNNQNETTNDNNLEEVKLDEPDVIDSNINYDQILNVPFVDETVDL